MGEPIPQSYKRHFDFPFWPVKSESELADYAEWLIDLVRHESNLEPGTRFDIRVLGRDREPPLPLAEFRERFDEFPFDKIFSASLDAWNSDESLKLEFRMETRMVGAKKATVTVTGNNKLRVQRIKTKCARRGCPDRQDPEGSIKGRSGVWCGGRRDFPRGGQTRTRPPESSCAQEILTPSQNDSA